MAYHTAEGGCSPSAVSRGLNVELLAQYFPTLAAERAVSIGEQVV